MKTGLLVLVLLCAGCQPRVAGTQSTLRITTAVGAGGVAAEMPSACLWLVGRAGGAQALIAVLAHGNITVRECQELPMLPYAPGVPLSP